MQHRSLRRSGFVDSAHGKVLRMWSKQELFATISEGRYVVDRAQKPFNIIKWTYVVQMHVKRPTFRKGHGWHEKPRMHFENGIFSKNVESVVHFNLIRMNRILPPFPRHSAAVFVHLNVSTRGAK